ncbi:kelch-like protein 24 [Arctopsyche grandis]|uniref:kelch-like protein 24 n=1 Tax=Arctopsyche grandis TaxID=121162 RepID=UPI00406D95F1
MSNGCTLHEINCCILDIDEIRLNQAMDLSNIMGMLTPLESLEQKAMDFIIDNFGILYKTPEFCRLPDSLVLKILRSDRLNVSSEEEVFHAVRLWITFDENNRKEKLIDMLSSVRLTLLSLEFFLLEVVELCEPFEECMINLNQAVYEMMIPNHLSKPKYRMGRAKLAVIGDSELTDASSTIDIYDGVRNTWTQSKKLNIDRARFGSVVVNDWILIIGGCRPIRICEAIIGVPLSEVIYIDLKDGQIHELKSLNGPRFNFQVATISDDSSTDVYVIGGFSDYKTALTTVERWNSEKQIWKKNIARMLTISIHPGVSVINDNIYLTGGLRTINLKIYCTDLVQMYSPKNNKWIYCTPMIQKRANHSSVTINGKLYVGGGFCSIIGNQIRHLISMESFDPVANVWTSFSELPSARSGAALIFSQNKLFLIGGTVAQKSLDDVCEYDPRCEEWIARKSLSIPRTGVQALILPYDVIDFQ